MSTDFTAARRAEIDRERAQTAEKLRDEVDAWVHDEIHRALNRDPALVRDRRFLAEHGPGGRPPHPEHSQAESEARARQRDEAEALQRLARQADRFVDARRSDRTGECRW